MRPFSNSGWTRLVTFGRLLLSIVIIATCLGVVACGGGGDPEVEQTMRRLVASYNQKDVAGFLSKFTDKAVQEQYGVPREQATASIEKSIGDPPIEVRRLSNTQVSGSTATIDFEHTSGKVVVLEQVTMVKEDDQWKIDGFKNQPVEIPGGVTTVTVDATEFAFKLNGDVKDGDIALAVHNQGQQEHEVVVARIAPGVPLENLVTAIAQAGNQAANAPEAVQEIVAFGGYKPGESGNIVFAKTLDPGRYGLFCFFPDVNDPEQTPHALKGMYAEFSVPG
ncbi:MAG: hypothetical protein E6J43_01085 [Chloroflexi bacterium]|nr:MAG: hypothetical protein E6J43_01085 [Chloroflexota bacterium]